MKSILQLSVIIILLTITSFYAASTIGAQTSNDFLQASGRNLVYRGQTVLLQGANIHNIEALCSRYGSGGNWGSCNVNDIRITEADYQRMSQEGGNHFRFGMAYRWYQDNPTQMFAVLDQHIAWAKKHNIWLTFVVFTLPGDCYEGFTVQSCPFWNDTTMKNNFKNFWVGIANRYKNEPVVAGYDLINEPLPPNGSFTIWKTYAQELINAIRATDTNHLILVSSLSDPYFPSLFSGGNIVYEVHDYTPMSMSHSLSPTAYPGVVSEWCGSVLFSSKTIVGQSDTYSGTTYPSTSCNNLAERLHVNTQNGRNVPLYVGEWGPQVYGTFSGGYNYIKDRGTAYVNTLKVSHAYHSWKHSKDNWGVFPNQKDTSSSSMVPWYPLQLEAVRFSWTGSIKPNFTNTATTQPTPVSTPIAVLTGDANADNIVDGKDYVTWLNNYNKATSLGFSVGDFNSDGTVTGKDYVLWLNNYGRSVSTFPSNLTVTNSNIQLVEEKAPSGGNIFIRADVSSSIPVVLMYWYIDGAWKTQDTAAPWHLGNSTTGYSFPSGTHELRAVACLDSACGNWVDTKTTYAQ